MMATAKGHITPGTVPVSERHGDLSQKIIEITEDRLTLILVNHLAKVTASRDWVAPLAVLISIALTFASTDFKNNGLSKDMWFSLFILLGIASCAWLIRTLIMRTRAETLDRLVQRIKKGDATADAHANPPPVRQ